MTDKDRMKKILRENDYPMFSDEDFDFYISENNGDINAAIYQCLILKSEDTTLKISGLSCGDTSKYFKRLAQRYRTNNTGIL